MNKYRICRIDHETMGEITEDIKADYYTVENGVLELFRLNENRNSAEKIASYNPNDWIYILLIEP